MYIPENSFISLIEYNDPGVALVTWTDIDNEGASVVRYDNEDDISRIKAIETKQIDAIRDVPVDERGEVLRALCDDRT